MNSNIIRFVFYELTVIFLFTLSQNKNLDPLGSSIVLITKKQNKISLIIFSKKSSEDPQVIS